MSQSILFQSAPKKLTSLPSHAHRHPASLFKKGSLTALLSLSLAGLSTQAQAEDGVMMQYFQWYSPNDGTLWNQVQQEAPALAAAGITALWLPPAYKGASGALDVGYGVYDMYDLGEFDQRGSVRTKYGSKDEYLAAIDSAHRHGLQVYGDVVFNHRGGADTTEAVQAVRVDWNDRNREYGSDVVIDAWTGFNFSGRNDTYSSFKWHWYHFDGVDWAENLAESAIFKFRGTGKAWDWEVDANHGNYDYLMFADLDMDHPEVVEELNSWGQWYVNVTGVDGFRLDAVKHIKFSFFNDWLDSVRSNTGKPLFTVGEYWSYNKQELHNYITATGGRMSLFDAPLHMNFHQASNSGGNYNMATLMDNTLMKEQPSLAVTLVDNHDTQPCQALSSSVQDWFKPLAYAFILLREEGYPNIFHADYYGADYTASDNGCNNSHIRIAAQKDKLDILLAARKKYAYGPQISYLDHHDIIGWTRLGNSEHPQAMAVIMSDGPGGSKWMNVSRANKTFVDMTGNLGAAVVVSNADGWAEFPVNGGSYSVWIEQPDVAVNFSCHNGITRPGEYVAAVGNIPSLGNWNTANAVPMSANVYPSWKATISVPANRQIEWKCIKVKSGKVIWQNGDNNRFTSPVSGTASTSGSF
jgi:alpha-amylase